MKLFFVLLTLVIGMCSGHIILEILDYLLENAPGPSNEDNSVAERMVLDDDLTGVGRCAQLSGCKTFNGDKGCYGPSGTTECVHCFNFLDPNKRNVMRSDFYSYDLEYIQSCVSGHSKNCPQISHIDEMLEYMLLDGDDVAQTYQGAMWKDQQVPNLNFEEHYQTKFCDSRCLRKLKDICNRVSMLENIREWCHTSLELIENRVVDSVGPSSYILLLASQLGSTRFKRSTRLPDDGENPEDEVPGSADGEDDDDDDDGSAITTKPTNETEGIPLEKKEEFKIESLVSHPVSFHRLTADEKNLDEKPISRTEVDDTPCNSIETCHWPKGNSLIEYEEKAVVVSAAAIAFILSNNWWKNVNIADHPEFGQFGFAVQHSLMLAVFSGRLRLTIQPRLIHEKIGVVAGCDETSLPIVENYEGAVGNVYASLCAMFYDTNNKEKIKERELRYRPEIHVPNAEGCVEKTSGMVFIRPGDWIPISNNHARMGSKALPLGVAFYDHQNLTTVEFTNEGAKFFPPSIAVSLERMSTTLCDNAIANGPNYKGLFNKAGLRGIGGLCNWVTVW